MTKAEMEKAIIDKIKRCVAMNNEIDSERRAFIAKDIENGTNPDFWKDQFFFNGYIYEENLRDIISLVLFDKYSEVYKRFGKRFIRSGHYVNNLTDDEWDKVDRVIEGMKKANIIRFSKSGAMVRLVK